MEEAPNNSSSSNYQFNTECNKDEVSNVDSDSQKGYKAYCLMDSTSTNVLDQMHFINVMCVESTSCGFNDISSYRLTKGRKIDYNPRTHVIKKCKVWFDIGSWKFYYASIPQKDEFIVPENGVNKTYKTRDRMLKLIDWYNDSAKRGFDQSISQNVVLEGSPLTWQDLDYDISNLRIQTQIDENYDGGSAMKKHENLPVIKDTINSEPHNVTNSTSIDTTIDKTAYSFERLNKITKATNVYSSSSSYDASYELPERYCLKLDKDATPVPTPNATCPDGSPSVSAYFANLHTKGIRFASKCSNGVDISVGTNAGMNVTYFGVQDECSVSYDASCQIVIPSKPKCGQYEGPIDIRMVMNLPQTTDLKLESFGLDTTAKSYNSKSIIKGYNGSGRVTFHGSIKLSNGEEYTCQKTISINECSYNYCNIKKDDTYTGTGRTRYIITRTSGSRNGTFYAKTSNSSSKFLRLGEESDGHIFYVTSPNSGGTEKLASKHSIIAKVEYTGGCTLCCTEEEDPEIPKVPTKYGCNVDLDLVQTYCDSYYSVDEYNFDSPDECVAYYHGSCCPTYEEGSNDYDDLVGWCDDHSAEYGYPISSLCVNTCCQDQEKCVRSDNITYRPVSLSDPFPRSYISKANPGDRLVGRNWIGYEDNITTSESGGSVYNEAEYVITLNPTIIRDIRKESPPSSYYEYKDARNIKHDTTGTEIKETGGCNTTDSDGHIYKGYCSEFVQTSNHFEVIRGEKNSAYKYYE